MNNSHAYRILMVHILAIGLIIAPIAPQIATAEDRGSTATGSSTTDQPSGTAGGAAAGVDVSGTPDKTTPSGKGALAPPPRKKGQTPESPPETKDEKKEVPKGIGASAGPVGPASTDTGEGISMGWKITGGVLGLGLLMGLAGGGGGGGGGGGTTPGHQ